MKYKRYAKIKKRILAGAASSALAGILLFGGSTAYAEALDVREVVKTVKTSPMHTMHRWNSGTKASVLAVQLGLDKNFVKSELKSGKTLKQILQESGVDTTGLQRASRN